MGIAVDVTHASDYAAIDKRQVGDIQIGKGPVIDIGANINPILSDLFIDTAKKKKMEVQIAARPWARRARTRTRSRSAGRGWRQD